MTKKFSMSKKVNREQSFSISSFIHFYKENCIFNSVYALPLKCKQFFHLFASRVYPLVSRTQAHIWFLSPSLLVRISTQFLVYDSELRIIQHSRLATFSDEPSTLTVIHIFCFLCCDFYTIHFAKSRNFTRTIETRIVEIN